MGTITLRQALYLSRNVPAVKLFNEVGSDKVAFLKNLGIEYSTIHQSNAISSNTEEQDGTKYGASSQKWQQPMRLSPMEDLLQTSIC